MNINKDIAAPGEINFTGKGGELFGILLVNFILSLITLGIYYPWAKAARLKYLYQETSFGGSPFSFHGTGWEMFKGMIKVIGVFMLLLLVLYIGLIFRSFPVLLVGFGVYFLGLLFFMPLAIVSSLKYRLSRTSWRGIHGGYRGTYGSMLKIYLKGILLTILTLGVYGFWFWVSVYREIFSNIRLGNVRFSFRGEGDEFFIMNVKGYALTLLTLGIYYFWWRSEVYNYFFRHIVIRQEERQARFLTGMTGSRMFELLVTNFLLLVITLGIAFPWVLSRTMRVYAGNLSVEGEINFGTIVQTEENYTDAGGEAFIDGLDIQLV
jgi:uncharacterized membrane protein YjgN (DUF898 family)